MLWWAAYYAPFVPQFEHRDLHWGNVMVRPADSTAVAFRLRGVDIKVRVAQKASCLAHKFAHLLGTQIAEHPLHAGHVCASPCVCVPCSFQQPQ